MFTRTSKGSLKCYLKFEGVIVCKDNYQMTLNI